MFIKGRSRKIVKEIVDRAHSRRSTGEQSFKDKNWRIRGSRKNDQHDSRGFYDEREL